jgi:hypothetical protein
MVNLYWARRPIIRLSIVANSTGDGLLDSEWMWAIALCALPFLVFAGIEMAGAWRRRRLQAIAQRPKGRDSAKRAG